MDIARVRPHPSGVVRGSTFGEGGFETVEVGGHEGLRCGAMRLLGSPGLTSPGVSPPGNAEPPLAATATDPYLRPS